MIEAPLAKHVNGPLYVEFLVAARLANFELFSTTCGGTGVEIMVIVRMAADIAKSASSRAGRHSTSVDCSNDCRWHGVLLDSKDMHCFASCQRRNLKWMILHVHELNTANLN